MKTKREIIQEAYAEYWEIAKDHVTENGWVDSKTIPNIYENGLDERFEQSLPQRSGMSKPTFVIRPKSLKGIEDNNGWNVFNYEKLPKDIDCHVFNGNGDMVVLSSNVINSISKNSLANITHYRAIDKPKPPLY